MPENLSAHGVCLSCRLPAWVEIDHRSTEGFELEGPLKLIKSNPTVMSPVFN